MIDRRTETGIIFAVVYPSIIQSFFSSRAGIVRPVAPRNEKLKRLKTEFTELRGNHAEE
jgi:hypothetical protein